MPSGVGRDADLIRRIRQEKPELKSHREINQGLKTLGIEPNTLKKIPDEKVKKIANALKDIKDKASTTTLQLANLDNHVKDILDLNIEDPKVTKIATFLKNRLGSADEQVKSNILSVVQGFGKDHFENLEKFIDIAKHNGDVGEFKLEASKFNNNAMFIQFLDPMGDTAEFITNFNNIKNLVDGGGLDETRFNDLVKCLETAKLNERAHPFSESQHYLNKAGDKLKLFIGTHDVPKSDLLRICQLFRNTNSDTFNTAFSQLSPPKPKPTLKSVAQEQFDEELKQFKDKPESNLLVSAAKTLHTMSKSDELDVSQANAGHLMRAIDSALSKNQTKTGVEALKVAMGIKECQDSQLKKTLKDTYEDQLKTQLNTQLDSLNKLDLIKLDPLNQDDINNLTNAITVLGTVNAMELSTNIDINGQFKNLLTNVNAALGELLKKPFDPSDQEGIQNLTNAITVLGTVEAMGGLKHQLRNFSNLQTSITKALEQLSTSIKTDDSQTQDDITNLTKAITVLGTVKAMGMSGHGGIKDQFGQLNAKVTTALEQLSTVIESVDPPKQGDIPNLTNAITVLSKVRGSGLSMESAFQTLKSSVESKITEKNKDQLQQGLQQGKIDGPNSSDSFTLTLNRDNGSLSTIKTFLEAEIKTFDDEQNNKIETFKNSLDSFCAEGGYQSKSYTPISANSSPEDKAKNQQQLIDQITQLNQLPHEDLKNKLVSVEIDKWMKSLPTAEDDKFKLKEALFKHLDDGLKDLEAIQLIKSDIYYSQSQKNQENLKGVLTANGKAKFDSGFTLTEDNFKKNGRHLLRDLSDGTSKSDIQSQYKDNVKILLKEPIDSSSSTTTYFKAIKENIDRDFKATLNNFNGLKMGVDFITTKKRLNELKRDVALLLSVRDENQTSDLDELKELKELDEKIDASLKAVETLTAVKGVIFDFFLFTKVKSKEDAATNRKIKCEEFILNKINELDFSLLDGMGINWGGDNLKANLIDDAEERVKQIYDNRTRAWYDDTTTLDPGKYSAYSFFGRPDAIIGSPGSTALNVVGSVGKLGVAAALALPVTVLSAISQGTSLIGASDNHTKRVKKIQQDLQSITITDGYKLKKSEEKIYQEKLERAAIKVFEELSYGFAYRKGYEYLDMVDFTGHGYYKELNDAQRECFNLVIQIRSKATAMGLETDKIDKQFKAILSSIGKDDVIKKMKGLGIFP